MTVSSSLIVWVLRPLGESVDARLTASAVHDGRLLLVLNLHKTHVEIT